MLENDWQDYSKVDTFEMMRVSMANSIARRVEGNKDCLCSINNLILFRRNAPVPPTLCLVETSIVLAVQGEKQMLVAGESYAYNASRFLITSLDIPAYSQVLEANPEKPCLGLSFKLDLRLMAELMAQGDVHLPAERSSDYGVGIGLGAVTPTLLEPFKRLIDLLDDPDSIPVLAPLIVREIHYRLLRSDQGARLWQIACVGSQGHRVARAIDWLKLNYSKTLRIEELAAHLQMSTSSLYQHFRQLTAMSPLQYQKWLRLSEARRLMFSEGMNAASAAFQVGYESPSQFSREYTALFGTPPKRDIEGLRRQFSSQLS
ncbi:AraC family transcriptional regulator [Pectobacterium polaris]|nr:AraC family transcriptional regulator [Pectobacterium polaris]ASY78847.1 AraC family transcriptional regulator [Pectobacterium polaris]MCA6954136.1 AraC family transcriptional regulator [Pectobacterium polaris]